MTLQLKLQSALRLLQSERAAEAEKTLLSALADAPDHPDVLQLLGMAAKLLGDIERAESCLRRSLEIRPGQPAVWNNLGNLLKQTGRTHDAAKAYEQAVRLAPDYADAWVNLGIARSAAGNPGGALEAYDRALALAPRTVRALNGKALALRALDRLDEAEAAVRAAAGQSPRDYATLSNLGNILRDRGKEADAAAVFERVLKLHPDKSHPRAALAAAYYNLGRFDECENMVRQVLAKEPDNAEAHRMLTTLLATTGRSDDLLSTYEGALSRHPGSARIWQSYISVLGNLGRYEAGLEAVDRARSACGDDPGLRLFQGRFLAASGDPEGALAILPSDPKAGGENARSIAIERARAHLRLGSFAEGADELEPLFRSAPDDYTVLAHLELLWRLAGDARSRWLLDYERFVQAIDVPVPGGFRDHAEFNAALADILTPLHVGTGHPPDQTLRGGTQTLGRLFQRTEPIIQQLKAAIEQAIASYVAGLKRDQSHPFLCHVGRPTRFTGSWSVRLLSQGYHVSHFHPEGWISSAYYVALPEVVADPETPDGRLHFGMPVVDVPGGAAPAREIQPRVGTLALFPSYCLHGTAPFSAPVPRLTVAFDVAPKQWRGARP